MYDIWLRLDNITLPALPGETAPYVTVPEVDQVDSGSDQCVFQTHVGITSVQFGIEHPFNPYYSVRMYLMQVLPAVVPIWHVLTQVYHSVYDDFDWYQSWGDPAFTYAAMMSQVWGTVALNLATDMV